MGDLDLTLHRPSAGPWSWAPTTQPCRLTAPPSELRTRRAPRPPCSYCSQLCQARPRLGCGLVTVPLTARPPPPAGTLLPLPTLLMARARDCFLCQRDQRHPGAERGAWAQDPGRPGRRICVWDPGRPQHPREHSLSLTRLSLPLGGSGARGPPPTGPTLTPAAAPPAVGHSPEGRTPVLESTQSSEPRPSLPGPAQRPVLPCAPRGVPDLPVCRLCSGCCVLCGPPRTPPLPEPSSWNEDGVWSLSHFPREWPWDRMGVVLQPPHTPWVSSRRP